MKSVPRKIFLEKCFFSPSPRTTTKFNLGILCPWDKNSISGTFSPLLSLSLSLSLSIHPSIHWPRGPLLHVALLMQTSLLFLGRDQHTHSLLYLGSPCKETLRRLRSFFLLSFSVPLGTHFRSDRRRRRLVALLRALLHLLDPPWLPPYLLTTTSMVGIQSAREIQARFWGAH